ncbi:MAG: methyltransferase domain-containing protein [Candidatus Pacebacteria bacterium]|nr:methyltransferase domain-containing protein [Candidatus Paceibacterota bacterium]
MAAKKKKHAWEWQNIAKNYCQLIIPNRPSLGDCENYGILIKKSLKRKKNPKIMVMGSTPELRAILLQYEILNGAETYCVDLNPGMYQAMTDFLARSGKYKEKYVKASWLKTGLPSNYFDLVVGDEVICNLITDMHNDLFEEISRVLKKGGAWITRLDSYLPKNKNDRVDKILIDLAKNINQGKYSLQYAVNILYIKMFYCATANTGNPKNSMSGHYVAAKEEYERTLKKHKLSKTISALLDLYKESFVKLGGDYCWYLISEKSGEKELENYFRIREKLYADDYATAENSPIYYLEKIGRDRLLTK